MNNVLALVAHPDDELTCAGTLMKLKSNGASVHLVVAAFSDLDITGEPMGLVQERLDELKACAHVLEIDHLYYPAFYDEDNFRWDQTHVKVFDATTQEIRPDLIISHSINDSNQTHHFLGQIAGTLARKNNASLWEMDQALIGGIATEGPSNNCLVDITDFHEAKLEAIRCYQSQLSRYPGLDAAMSDRDRANGWTMGTRYAEAFRVRKTIWL